MALTPLPLEYYNQLLLFSALLFIVCIACEWLKDDMKIIYQFVILFFAVAPITILLGIYLYTGVDNAGTTFTDPYMAPVLFFFGGVLALLAIIKLLYKPGDKPGVVVQSFGVGADYPAAPRNPQQPRKPGGF
jgi:peptidoglycan/LPS O-acetylase OafA/YrhL